MVNERARAREKKYLYSTPTRDQFATGEKWGTREYIIDSMDPTCVHASRARALKNNIPPAWRENFDSVLATMLAENELVEIRKDTYILARNMGD